MIKIPDQNYQEIFDIIKSDLVNGPWIAGGFPLSIYTDRYLYDHDIDVFVKSQDQLLKIQEKIQQYKHYESPVARTFQYKFKSQYRIQLILDTYDSLQSVFDSFDINICKIATDGKKIVASQEVFDSIDNKQFHMDMINKNAIKRFTKYYTYGFTPSRETMQLVREAINTGETPDGTKLLWNFRGVDEYQK